MFFDFSNHAGAQVPIFIPTMKNLEFARLARFARLSTRKWDFRRRSRPRELAQRSQDDVSLNKLPQINLELADISGRDFDFENDPEPYISYLFSFDGVC